MSADDGLSEALAYPLLNAIFHRRSRRISKGIKSVPAGSLSYRSDETPQPLTPLEEAVLIAVTGVTGLTMPDMPLETPEGRPLLGSPMLEIAGRAASSADNAQATRFIMINDSGTYFLRPPHDVDRDYWAGPLTPEKLIAYANACKVKLLDKRLDFPREYPCYVGRNGYVSNVEGSTLFMPIVDVTRQYINGMCYLLSQAPGRRPTFIDDWNWYRKAGCTKWVKNGFLNPDFVIPLGMSNTFRIHIEADLLVQNLLLTIQALGLGGWVHGGFFPPLLLGDPDPVWSQYGRGLAFRYHVPKKRLRYLTRFLWPLPSWRPNPVGLDGVIEGFCPPYYNSMSEAIDALMAEKYGPRGLYADPKRFQQIFKDGKERAFLEQVPHYDEEVIACCKDICTYIYETYGRFPAHVDAIHVPGVWVQAHHLDLAYYDSLYVGGYSSTQARHQALWHDARSSTPAYSAARVTADSVGAGGAP